MTFEDVKDRLRAAYIALRRQKQPYYNGGGDLEKSLDGGAKNCISAKITPEDYCTALYQKYGQRYDQFFPTQLTGAKALSIAQAFAANYRALTYQELFSTQRNLLSQVLRDTKRPVEYILADHALAFSPWFRITALAEFNSDVYEAYGREAKEELTPELKTFLREKGVSEERLMQIENYGRHL